MGKQMINKLYNFYFHTPSKILYPTFNSANM